MRERLLALAERRVRLMARAQDERTAINALLAPADGAASMAVSLFRTARRALAQARNHPLIVIAGVALLVALRPRRVISWIAKGWTLWGIYRSAQGWLQRFSAAAGTPPKSI